MTWVEQGPWWRYRSYDNRVVIQTRFGVDGEWHTVTHRATVEEAIEHIERRRMPVVTSAPIPGGLELNVDQRASPIAWADLCD